MGQSREKIISGKEFNLAELLLPSNSNDNSEKEYLYSGGGAVPIKNKIDQRLSKNLNVTEFVRAFGIYRSVVVDEYPHMSEPLSDYLNNVVDMANDFGGSLFYVYHKAFVKKAANALRTHGTKVDWSIVDNSLYNKIFAGRRANTCVLCLSVDHTTEMCAMYEYRYVMYEYMCYI